MSFLTLSQLINYNKILTNMKMASNQLTLNKSDISCQKDFMSALVQFNHFSAQYKDELSNYFWLTGHCSPFTPAGLHMGMKRRFLEGRPPFLVVNDKPSQSDLCAELLMLSKSHQECMIMIDKILSDDPHSHFNHTCFSELKEGYHNFYKTHQDYLYQLDMCLTEQTWVDVIFALRAEEMAYFYDIYDVLFPYTMWISFSIAFLLFCIFFVLICAGLIKVVMYATWWFKGRVKLEQLV